MQHVTLCFFFSHSVLWNAPLQDLTAPVRALSKSSNFSPQLWELFELLTNHCRMKCYSRQATFRRSSLLDSGRVVRASRLDDLWPRGAGLVVLVTVIGGGAVAALVLTDVDNHTRGGGRGRVELVLLPWDSHKTWTWFVDLVQPPKMDIIRITFLWTSY